MYNSIMRTTKVQVSPEPILFAQVSGRPKGKVRERTRCVAAKGPGTDRLIQWYVRRAFS